MKLEDKVAIITGAARGIGKAIAERYVKEGAKVVIADLNEQGAKAVASALGPNALGIKLDITEQASIDATVAATIAHFGGLDILVNNAGIFDLAPIVEITRESYRRVYAVNVEGLLFMLQAGAKQMISQRRGGKIINLASQAGRRGEALVAVYCSSKAAVISLTQSAGLDLIKHHINVNAIAPGVVDNEHWDHVDSLFAKYEHLKAGEKKRMVGAAVPYGRMARPDEIGGLATFLGSEDADYIVAQTYNIDGGNWMS
jgi:D-sorbitol dehydrogenase (acceptor)